ncbi:MAG: DNA polymerase III subunit alpha, partial [Oligoflexales bacterium]|nr:DNA polymerase III subunit alpha [Oligoflexales bacterium]
LRQHLCEINVVDSLSSWLKNNPKDLFSLAISGFVESAKLLYGDDFYIELIDNNLPEQQKLISDLVDVAEELNVEIVASADAHYLKSEDAEIHTVLLAIRNGLTMAQLRQRRRNARFHLLNNQEMTTLFQAWPRALKNTLKIADLVDLKLEFGKYILPQYTIAGETTDESLVRLAKLGLEKRFADMRRLNPNYLDPNKESEYLDRLLYEIEIITKMNFAGYFLIVQDFINWAKEQKIPVGPARGSGAGSLVAYALKITDLDPLPYGLIFERFLNPERVSMPDFDVDFCQWRRDEVIDYVAQKYGSDNVAQIITFGELKAKAALKSVGRALGMPYLKVDRFTKLVPEELNITLEKALADEPRLKEEMKNDPSLDELMRIALQIEGTKSHTSVHAAGVVISDGKMTDHVPVLKNLGENSLITQYEMKNAEKVGMIKFDFLGLKTLTVIDKAVAYVQKNRDENFSIEGIPLNDKKVYKLISSGKTTGIFQLEGGGMQQLVVKLKPSCIEDVISLVALFRPGPLGSGMVDDFIERKHGRQKIEYPHASLIGVLKETYGIILYQEQVQKIAAIMANYSLGEADILRRAMGKKNAAEMAQQKARFVEGAHKNDIDDELAVEIFDLMAKFADYGFNKSHSAAYGLIAYQTAYLKTHYPAEFMAAIMSCDMDRTDKIIRYVEDCRNLGLIVSPPSINESVTEFVPLGKDKISFGLSAIKGLGTAVSEQLILERNKNGTFKNLAEFSERLRLADIGKKNIELLVRSGCLDCFEINRTTLFELIPLLLDHSVDFHKAKTQGMRNLFSFATSGQSDEQNRLRPWNEVELRAQAKVLDRNMEVLLEEKRLLGVFLSEHPLSRYTNDAGSFASCTLEEVAQVSLKQGERKTLQIIAYIADVSERRTKKGARMAYVKLESDKSSLEAMMFEKVLEREGLPATERVSLVTLSVDKGFDGSKLRVQIERIENIEKIRQERVESVRLVLRPEVDSELRQLAIAENFVQTLHKHAGQTALLFDIDLGYAKVELAEGSAKGVNLSDEFMASILKLKDLKTELHYKLKSKQ